MEFPGAPLKVTVAIATRRRKALLEGVLTCIGEQTQLPDQVILAPTDAACDLPICYPPRVAGRLLICEPVEGLTKQRNACLGVATGDIIIFFDDDFFPDKRYIETMTRLFRDEAVVGATGVVVKNKAELAGLCAGEVEHLLDARQDAEAPNTQTRIVYGCNMAFRMATIRRHNLRFDERLPLYGWLEDVDFGARIGRLGRLTRSSACRGVHFMSASGRHGAVMHGYSQIANLRYLYRKRVVTAGYALALGIRNVGGNLLRAFAPERTIDRRGRLRGNLMAFADLIKGKLDPGRICEL
jgi:glycosyltransferase involved in cell wall biosynthesis